MLNHVERFDAEVVSDHIHTAELKQRPFKLIGDAGTHSCDRIKDVQSDKTKDIDLKGVFITIGHQPNTQIFEDQLDINNGYLTIKSGTEGQATMTSIPGVFAVGDRVYRQAITSAGSGCMAAIDAETWMDNQ